MNALTPCPSCGRVISFSSYLPAFKNCECGKVLQLTDRQTVVLSEWTALADFPDLIQPGTTGTFQGKAFTINGRMQLRFPKAAMNFWDMSFFNGEQALLMEGYGLYAVLWWDTNKPKPVIPHVYHQMWINATWDVLNKQFVLEDKRRAKAICVEGEFRINEVNTKPTVYHYSEKSGQKLTMIDWVANKPVLYEMTPVRFVDLYLKQLRQPSLTGKTFNCGKCKSGITVKHYPYTISLVCSSCDTIHVREEAQGFEELDRIEYKIEPAIPIGTEGILNGVSYKVTGITEKVEAAAPHYDWREYTLYNEQEGYATLSEFNGNWMLAKEDLYSPLLKNAGDDSITMADESFIKYNEYQSVVKSAAGEFPYNIQGDRNTKVKEFISPPEMWIREDTPDEGICWFKGVHINRSEVKKAFSVQKMPAKAGIGAVQPTGYMNKYKLVLLSLLGVLLLGVIHLVMGDSKLNQVVVDETHNLIDSLQQQSFVTSKFRLDKSISNLQLEVSAPVRNNWFELGITLVNAETGTEYSMEQGVEYYFGVSEGESWTEGGQSTTGLFTAIPRGTYFMQLQSSRELSSAAEVNYFSVKGTYDVSTDRNMWFGFLILLIWPVFRLLKDFANEQNRWNDNDNPLLKSE